MRNPKPTQLHFIILIVILSLFAVMPGCDDRKTADRSFNDTNGAMTIEGIRSELPGNLTVKYALSNFDRTQNRYTETRHETRIDPKKSALVIVDVWNREYLNSMTSGFINPLINKLRKLGAKIIYAPSQGEHNDSLWIAPGSVTFTHSETMDDYLLYHDIENLFYVGFDTYHCLADKPNGIFSFRLRNRDKGIRMFVFERGVMSETKEMKQAALALLKRHDVGVIEADPEAHSEVFPETTLLDFHADIVCAADTGSSLVLIFKSDIRDESLDQFEGSLAGNNIPYGVVLNDVLIYGEHTLTGIDQLLRLLKDLKIRNLYYCGYHLNDEMLWSEFGVTPLYIKRRYSNLSELPEIFVISDLSYIAPSDGIDPDIEKAVMINHYRDVKNILSATLITGLKRKDNIVPPFRDVTYDWRVWQLYHDH